MGCAIEGEEGQTITANAQGINGTAAAAETKPCDNITAMYTEVLYGGVALAPPGLITHQAHGMGHTAIQFMGGGA